MCRAKWRTGARPVWNYPAQLKPPPEPQLLLDELEAPREAPNDAKVVIFFLVSWPWQVGQVWIMSASENRTIFSNSVSQPSQ
jgi:hypothetical protein